MLTLDKSKELRWLSLSRVSGSNAKRPDHVLQLFGIGKVPIIFTVESKEAPNSVEPRIGPRLRNYVTSLLASPASVERDGADAIWSHSDRSLEPVDFQIASAAAFLMGHSVDVLRVREMAEADLQIGLIFSTDGLQCEIHLFPDTTLGQMIAEFIAVRPAAGIPWPPPLQTTFARQGSSQTGLVTRESTLGQMIAEFITGLPLGDISLSAHVHQ